MYKKMRSTFPTLYPSVRYFLELYYILTILAAAHCTIATPAAAKLMWSTMMTALAMPNATLSVSSASMCSERLPAGLRGGGGSG